jgi:hypothetical protein
MTEHMKKTLLICFYCLSVVIANAQKYIPFPSNAIIYGDIGKCMPDGWQYRDYRIEIGGDTLIKNIHYAKYYTEMGIRGGIRNDIPGKKVYLYRFDNQTENLLYDFNMKVGDTVLKDNGGGFFPSLLSTFAAPGDYAIKIDTAWVSRIDSVLMSYDGLYHKRFNFMAKVRIYSSTSGLNDPDPIANSDVHVKLGDKAIKMEPLIEGIGMYYNPVSYVQRFEQCWRMGYYCISISNKTVLASDPFGQPHNPKLCGPLYTGIDDKTNADKILIYPNPSSGKFQLTVNGSKNISIEISDVLGKKILHSTIENETTEIDLSTEKPGVYFIHIYDSAQRMITKKIVIK